MTLPRISCPIVLVHGLFGFDQLRMGNWWQLDYFHGIPQALRQVGNRVVVARLSPTRGIASRAEQLRALIETTSPHEPVHILAHSMGGLDARHMISRMGMASRVLSLTTLGTPHRGSPFADWALDRWVRLFGPVFDYFGLPREAFLDLTVERCRRFNQETPDAPGVRYFSVGGEHHLNWANPSWNLTAPIVERAEGPNDGIVSVASAGWGESFEVWDADHMNLVNWPQNWAGSCQIDRIPHYAQLIGRLRDLGF